MHCWEEYAKHRDLPIIAYENGLPLEGEEHESLPDIIDDKHRQLFYNGYIQTLCEAVTD